MIGARIVDRYDVVAELGRGGMGVVYRARDPLLNRDVAVKVIPPALLTPAAEERFQREAQIVAQMNHPSIVSIFDIGRHEGSLFFLMPVITGRNLRAYLSVKPRSVGDVVEIGLRVAEALEYSHARGVIHRDIKPENIMIADEEGSLRVYVMDFGLAKASSENRLTKTGTLIGTVAYFSPEQVIAREVDSRSDIYALGVVLYECLAGDTPFTGEVQSLLYRIVNEYPRSIRSVGTNISQELDEIILTCLAKDPARRYQKASDLIAALRRCQSRLGEAEMSVVLSTVHTSVMQRPAASQLIDREKEFAELQRRLNAAMAGECQFAVIGGDTGVGKTRLAEEMENLARARKVRVIRGRFIEENRALPYHGLLELLQDYFRNRDSSSSGTSVADFSDLAPELLSVFPSLGDIAGLRTSAPDAAPRRSEDRTYVFELLARTIGRMSGGQPLIVILENLHAAEGSLEAVQYIFPRLSATPLFFIGTFRQSEVQRGHPLLKMLDAFADDPRFASITLGPLTPSHHRELVLSVIGGGTIAPEVFERIFEATEGNPFFTRELIRSLIESGGIVRDATGAWNLSGEMAISADALPATIQQAVEKRVERLPQENREVLAASSILGKSFHFDDLAGLIDDENVLERSIDRLVADGLLEEDRESRSDRLAFTSAIVRDVLYGSLSPRRRRALHRRYAEHLERSTKRPESAYPQLVHHYSEGDVPEKSVHYGMLHARRSLESFSTDEAIQVLRIVIEFASDSDWNGSRTAEAEARLLLARAHRMEASHVAAIREAETAHRLLMKSGDRELAVDALLFAAHATWDARKIDEATRWVDEGVELARSANRIDALTDLLSLGATIANMRADYERARLYLEEAQRLAPREQSAREELPSGGVLRSAISNLVGVTDPVAVNTDEDAEITALAFEKAVTTDDSGRVRGVLARSWQSGDDGRSLRLHLDPAARFADGSPVLASDVKASFERAARARTDKIPAALEAVSGISEFRSGASGELAGLRVIADRELLIDLTQPLGFYPAMLTDPSLGIAKLVDGAPIGSGPFVFDTVARDRFVLTRNEHHWRTSPSRIDRIEFEVFPDAQAITTAFRDGKIDLARDLSPRDVEDLLRDTQLRPTFVEAPRKNTYFLLFNQNGPLAADAELRGALAGALNVHDLVWRSIGRLGQPAVSIVPPSIFGHDAGRRARVLSREVAAARIEQVRSRRGSDRLRLVATAHPTFFDRYQPLAAALAEAWKHLGVDLEIRPSTVEEYLASFVENEGVDLLIGRWNVDYDDGDNFTYGLFHSQNGVFRSYFSSAASDHILEQARVEPGTTQREALYRSFENLLRDSAAVVPLFYEINYRVASQRVRGIHLGSTRPYVNYEELGVSDEGAASAPALVLRTSEIHVPLIEEMRSIDPLDLSTFNELEVLGTVFECLTQCSEVARIAPHLAESFAAEAGGRRWRFKLREGIRFHDGRRLTARDVRFSWERKLGRADYNQQHVRYILGAVDMGRGEARELEGFHIVSPLEFVVELTEPISFFPALASAGEASIVPEGTTAVSGSWRDGGCIGTGPFRLVEMQPGRSVELERNPDYWRPGVPRCDRLTFHLGMTPAQIKSDFIAGKLSIASDLSPSDVEALLHDRELGSGFHAVPRLCVYFVALNPHSPRLSDPAVRRALLGSIDVDAMVRRTLGRVAVPASGLIPPGLVGHVSTRPPSESGDSGSLAGLRLSMAIQPLFLTQFGAFTRAVQESLSARGVTVEAVNRTIQEYLDAVRLKNPDVVVGRWVGSISDADYFTSELLHTRGSFLGHVSGTVELDALMDRARCETNVTARNALYRQIEEALARDALMLPLFYEQATRFARPEVEGLTLNFTHPEVAYDMLAIRR